MSPILLLAESDVNLIIKLLETLGPITFASGLFLVVFYRVMMKILSNQEIVNRHFFDTNSKRDDEIHSLRKDALENLEILRGILEHIKVTTLALKNLEDATTKDLGSLHLEVQNIDTQMKEFAENLKIYVDEMNKTISEVNSGINDLLNSFMLLEEKIKNEEEKVNGNTNDS